MQIAPGPLGPLPLYVDDVILVGAISRALAAADLLFVNVLCKPVGK